MAANWAPGKFQNGVVVQALWMEPVSAGQLFDFAAREDRFLAGSAYAILLGELPHSGAEWLPPRNVPASCSEPPGNVAYERPIVRAPGRLSVDFHYEADDVPWFSAVRR